MIDVLNDMNTGGRSAASSIVIHVAESLLNTIFNVARFFCGISTCADSSCDCPPFIHDITVSLLIMALHELQPNTLIG